MIQNQREKPDDDVVPMEVDESMYLMEDEEVVDGETGPVDGCYVRIINCVLCQFPVLLFIIQTYFLINQLFRVHRFCGLLKKKYVVDP